MGRDLLSSYPLGWGTPWGSAGHGFPLGRMTLGPVPGSAGDWGGEGGLPPSARDHGRGGPRLPGEVEQETALHPLGGVRTWTYSDLRRRSSELGIRRLPISWALVASRHSPPQSGLFPFPVKWA